MLKKYFLKLFLNKKACLEKDLKSEMEDLGSYFLIAIMLTTVIIFSFLQLARGFIYWLAQFPHSFLLSMIFFSLLLMTSLYAFYHLRNKQKKQKEVINNSLLPIPNEMDIQHLVVSFTEGLMKGINNSTKQFSYESPKKISLIKQTSFLVKDKKDEYPSTL
jgi:hypothetical protein